MMAETFADAQTTITSLVAAVAGSVSDRAGDFVASALGLQGNGLGGAGLEFCVRAVVSAGVFSLTSRALPETSGNIFFSILYFAADAKLVGLGVRIGHMSVGITEAALLRPVALRKSPPKEEGSCGCK